MYTAIIIKRDISINVNKLVMIMNYCNVIIIILILFQIHLFNTVDVDPHKTIAWGPGLNPEKIVMRARYFFLQLVDVNGKK